MRVMGIDPGLQITGYGVIDVDGDSVALVEGGVVRTAADDPLPARLQTLHDGLVDVVTELRPDTVAVEQLYSHYRHPRTAILMGHARGVALLAVSQLPVVSYNATAVKRTLTGGGRASKEQLRAVIQRRLKLRRPPDPLDVSDALAVALCHATRCPDG